MFLHVRWYTSYHLVQHLVVVACVAFDIGEHGGFTKIKASFVLCWLTSVPELSDKARKKIHPQEADNRESCWFYLLSSLWQLWILFSAWKCHTMLVCSFSLEKKHLCIFQSMLNLVIFFFKYAYGLLSSLRDFNVCYELHSTDKNYKAHVKRAPLRTCVCTFNLKPFEFVSVIRSNEIYRPEGVCTPAAYKHRREIMLVCQKSQLVWLDLLFYK